jgi:hypothetical protein
MKRLVHGQALCQALSCKPQTAEKVGSARNATVPTKDAS